VKGKWREQEQARLLRQSGESLNEIVARLGISKSSVSIWTRDILLDAEKQQRIERKKLIGGLKGRRAIIAKWKEYRRQNPKIGPNLELKQNLQQIKGFFSTWSNEMAYVLGFFAADGCMYHSANGGYSTGGYYIVFYSTDLQLLDTIKKIMGIRNKIEVEDRSHQNTRWKIKYSIRLVNRDLYQRFLQLGMTPTKSLTLRFPRVPATYLASFVRGYFDGDGHVYIGQYFAKDRNKLRHILQAGFTSGSRGFLQGIQKQLSTVAGIGLGSLHAHGENWALTYSASDARQLYRFLYPTNTVPCLLRKRLKFEEGMALFEK
jgi:hypothetical protein